MTTLNNHLNISTVRADALFASALQRSGEPSGRQVRQAIAAAVRRLGDRGCAERVAQEFGDHPELAAARMRWARQAVAAAFGGPSSRDRDAPAAQSAARRRRCPTRNPTGVTDTQRPWLPAADPVIPAAGGPRRQAA